MSEKLGNFFIFLGPDKTGSSWLGAMLSRHNHLCVSPAKDIYYFDRYYRKGWGWYRSLFPCGNDKILCDISHDYLFSDDAAGRIKSDLVNVKLLTILRSPLERSFSQFLYYYRNGKVDLDFSKAVVKYPEILENSNYSKFMPFYDSRFDENCFKVMLFEDMLVNPECFIKDIFQFIGVSTDNVDYTGASNKVRAASAPKNRIIASFVKEVAVLLRAMGFANLVGRVKSSSMSSIFYENFKEKPVLGEQEIAEYGHLFLKDIEYLEENHSLDLSRWKSDLHLS